MEGMDMARPDKETPDPGADVTDPLGRMGAGPIATVLDHWKRQEPAFLLLTGDHGSGKTQLLGQVEGALTQLGASW
jgi:hypothetical protein